MDSAPLVGNDQGTGTKKRSMMKLTVFDLDHTLLSVNSSYVFGQYLYRQRFYSFISMGYCVLCYALHKVGYLPIPQLHQRIFQSIFNGKTVPELERAAESFLDLHLSEMVYEPALMQLKEAQREGYPIVILSSAPDFLVKPIASRLGVNLWEATCYAINTENRLCGISHVVQGKDKANAALKIAAQMGISNESIVVYTDSYLDLPLLEVAGSAIGVNPDKKLRGLCQQKGWKII
jgi:phosphoserine phosphatase